MTTFPVCCHEAGHAAAHLQHGPDRAEVTSIIVDGETGWCHARSRRLDPHERAILHLAGHAAETRALYGPGARAKGVANDPRPRAAAALGNDPQALHRAWQDAVRLVDKHWPFIEVAAAALQRTGCLTGAQVARLWASCPVLVRSREV